MILIWEGKKNKHVSSVWGADPNKFPHSFSCINLNLYIYVYVCLGQVHETLVSQASSLERQTMIRDPTPFRHADGSHPS